jgi:hypothetical protein
MHLVFSVYFVFASPEVTAYNGDVFLLKRKRKRPLRKPRRRWINNIRMDLVGVGWGDVDWIGLAQDRNRWRALVDSVLNLRVP